MCFPTIFLSAAIFVLTWALLNCANDTSFEAQVRGFTPGHITRHQRQRRAGSGARECIAHLNFLPHGILTRLHDNIQVDVRHRMPGVLPEDVRQQGERCKEKEHFLEAWRIRGGKSKKKLWLWNANQKNTQYSHLSGVKKSWLTVLFLITWRGGGGLFLNVEQIWHAGNCIQKRDRENGKTRGRCCRMGDGLKEGMKTLTRFHLFSPVACIRYSTFHLRHSAYILSS